MKKRISRLCVLLAVCLLATVGIFPAAAVPAVSGNWTDSGKYDVSWYTDHEGEAEYGIHTAAQLAGLAYLVNHDVDLFENTVFTVDPSPDEAIDLSAHNWVPIGTDEHPFLGTFDGNGCQISGLKVKAEGMPTDAGLFGCAGTYGAQAKLQNVCLEIEEINGSRYVGGLVGCCKGQISGVTVTLNGKVTSTGVAAGGVVGFSTGAVTDAKLSFGPNGSVRGAVYAGGAAGHLNGSDAAGSAILRNITLQAPKVTAGNGGAVCAGGVVGMIQGSAAKNTYMKTQTDPLGVYEGVTNASISGLVLNVIGATEGVGTEDAYVGGVAGQIEKASLYDCRVTQATIAASGFRTTRAGGVAGEAGNAYLVNNTATDCGLTGSNAECIYAGGFAGDLNEVTARFNRVLQGSEPKTVLANTAKTVYIGGFAGALNSKVDSFSENSTDQAVAADVESAPSTVYAGGMIGQIGNIETTTAVSACYAAGSCTVKGDNCYAGGFAGSLSGGTVDSCYAAGSVIANDGWQTATSATSGGFAGSIESGAAVSNCYAVGETVKATGTSTALAGGFAGDHKGTLSAIYAVAEGPLFGQKTGSAAAVYSDGLKTSSSLVGFDFTGKDAKWCYLDNQNEGRPMLIALENWGAWPDFDLIRKSGFTTFEVKDAQQLGTAVRLLNELGGDADVTPLLTDGRASVSRGTGSVSITLSDDIDLGGKLWLPLEKLFVGDVLEGNNTTINGLTFTVPEYPEFGLVRNNQGKIQNLRLDGATVRTSSETVPPEGTDTSAGLAAGTNGGSISNITVTNATLTGWGITGGVAGTNAGALNLISFSGTVEGVKAGGIVGVNGKGGTIATARSEADVTGADTAGGVAGENSGTIGAGAGPDDLGNVVSDAAVKGAYAGGIVGKNYDGGLVQYSDTLSGTEKLRGEAGWGGIAAYNEGRVEKPLCRFGKCPLPQPKTSPGVFYGSLEVGLIHEMEDAKIYYLLDGEKTPIRYTAPFTLTKTATIRMMAKTDGMFDSDETSVTYTRQAQASESGGRGSEPERRAEVSGSNNSLNIRVTVSGDRAELEEITAEQAKHLGTGEGVVVDLTKLDAKVNSVTISKTTLNSVAGMEPSKVEIKLDNGSVVLDRTAFTALANEVKGELKLELIRKESTDRSMTDSQKETIAKLTDAEVLDITIFDGQTQLSELGGGRATISVNYPLKPGQSEQGVAARYVAEDGRVTEQPVRYTGQTAAFTITHCSVYVISYDEGRAARACPRDESCPMAAFRDTDRNAWYHDGVHWALKNGVMNGVSDSEFDPAGLTTRAMLIMMLWRLEGEPSASFELHFRDVSEGQWYTDAVRWAASTGVVSGYSDTEFGPEDTLTREQLAGILYRYAQYKGLSADEDTSLGGYKDASQVGDWAVPAMSWAVGAGIINGVEENALAPTDGASRSQVATVLMRCSALH